MTLIIDFKDGWAFNFNLLHGFSRIAHLTIAEQEQKKNCPKIAPGEEISLGEWSMDHFLPCYSNEIPERVHSIFSGPILARIKINKKLDRKDFFRNWGFETLTLTEHFGIFSLGSLVKEKRQSVVLLRVLLLPKAFAMKHFFRKTTPKADRSKIPTKQRTQRKISVPGSPVNRFPEILKEKPGPGYRHILKKRDLLKFVSILPDWDQLSQGLHSIILAPGDPECDGWHLPGIVAVCAWERQLWRKNTEYDYEPDRDLIQRLDVPLERVNGKLVICKFNEASVRGFQLLRILLHELGHHHDQMTTRSKVQPSRGEPYAESYARKYENLIWERYLETFGIY